MNDHRNSDSALIWIVLLVAVVGVAVVAGGTGWFIARQRMMAEIQVREEMLRAQEEMLRIQAMQEAQWAEDAARREYEAELQAADAARDPSAESTPEVSPDDGTESAPAEATRPEEE